MSSCLLLPAFLAVVCTFACGRDNVLHSRLSDSKLHYIMCLIISDVVLRALACKLQWAG